VRTPIVLAYHGIGELPAPLDPSGMMVPAAAFRRHVALLRGRGYEFVTQAELARRLSSGDGVESTCSVTFDDGLENNLTVVAGLLDELGVPGTFYVCPGLLGEPYPFALPEAGMRFLTEEELLRLAAQPHVEIGSHTARHTELDDADADEAHAEMDGSKRALEGLLQTPIVSFAYPSCGYSPACPAAAERAGYTSAVTCGALGGLTPYELRRVSPNPVEGRLVYELRLRGLFHALRDTPPARLVRRAVRGRRYG
jgi:peptidoglycan/xylan/chitin deacetylase (PgdA/CDA1 family)